MQFMSTAFRSVTDPDFLSSYRLLLARQVFMDDVIIICEESINILGNQRLVNVAPFVF